MLTVGGVLFTETDTKAWAVSGVASVTVRLATKFWICPLATV